MDIDDVRAKIESKLNAETWEVVRTYRVDDSNLTATIELRRCAAGWALFKVDDDGEDMLGNPEADLGVALSVTHWGKVQDS